ncbi:prolyl oligopeptidase family serine peptidase [Candidatus Hydrogenedentota bacterium]
MSRTAVIVASVLCVLALGCSTMPVHKPPQLNFVDVEGYQYPYRLIIPKEYNALDKTQAWPLAICLHGAGGDENSYLTHKSGRDSIAPYAEKRGYVIALPAGTRSQKELATQVPLEVIKEVIKHGRIDTKRIYVTGFSKGGALSYKLIQENPDMFAAGYPVVCAPWDEVLPGLEKTPLKILLGTKDKHFSIEKAREQVEKIRDAGGEVELFLPDGGHGGYRRNWAYDMIFDWFDSHVKPVEAP